MLSKVSITLLNEHFGLLLVFDSMTALGRGKGQRSTLRPISVGRKIRAEDSIGGSWVCHFEKVKLHPSHSLATKGAVLAVEAFTFFVGLAWLGTNR